MIDEPAAREIALTKLSPDEAVLGAARELDQGWFFPCVMKNVDVFVGVVVHKGDGHPLMVPAGSPMARDPALYDRGYQFLLYAVVVLTVSDFDQTVRVLHEMHPGTVDTYYKFDRVNRVRRGMTEAEIRDRLRELPSVFNGTLVYHIDKFEEAREAGWFTFKVLEYRPKS